MGKTQKGHGSVGVTKPCWRLWTPERFPGPPYLAWLKGGCLRQLTGIRYFIHHHRWSLKSLHVMRAKKESENTACPSALSRNGGIRREIGCDQKRFAASQTKSQRCCSMFPLPTASSRVTPLCLNTLSLRLLSNHSEGSARKKKRRKKKKKPGDMQRAETPTHRITHRKQRFCMCREGTGKVADQPARMRVCVCVRASACVPVRLPV